VTDPPPPEPDADDVEAATTEEQRDAEAQLRADAELLLRGPGLVPPADPPTPSELEGSWGEAARHALVTVLADLHEKRVGLAISGGGALGSFETGVLRFVYDHLRISPVAICGNSAGALNAAKLAQGDHGTGRAIDEVERVWRSLRVNLDMWEAEPWLLRLQASASWASTLREQVGDTNGAGGAVRVAVRVVGSLVRRPPETDGTIDAIRDALRAQSMLSLSPVGELVERELDREAVARSGIALRVGTVSLEAGELRYVTETGELHDRHDQPIGQPPVDLAQGILASASIPVAFAPVDLNGEHYVDGGAREILPLELLVHRLGVERVIAISASSLGIDRSPSFAHRNLLDILRRVSAEIAPNETLRKELNPPGGWPEGVRLVVPEFDVHDTMTIDPALIAISIDHGWLRAADVLLGLPPEARRLTEDITRLRVELRRRAAPLPTAFGFDDDTVVEVEAIDPETPLPDRAELEEQLRRLVEQRRDLGAPVPATLLAWLADPASGAGVPLDEVLDAVPADAVGVEPPVDVHGQAATPERPADDVGAPA
jgi:predicted acylesterase/phospholipase RssA